jgi:hypothetical protein
VQRYTIDGRWVDGWSLAKGLEQGVDPDRVAVGADGTVYVTANNGNGSGSVSAWGPTRREGWRMEIFGDAETAGAPALVTRENAPEQDWGSLSPGAGLDPSVFSVRMRRDLALGPGRHTFVLNARGGARVIADGSVVIDAWDAAEAQGVARVDWTGGLMPVTLEYTKKGPFAGFALSVPQEDESAVPTATAIGPPPPGPTETLLPPTETATPTIGPGSPTATVTRPAGGPSGSAVLLPFALRH